MEKYDVVIVGGGPAGLTSAVYASRGNLSTIFIEKATPGGKMVKTFSIENWTGDKKVSGPDLSLRMFEHSTEFGAKYKYGEVVKIDSEHEFKKIITLKSGEKIEAKSVIIATGMLEKVPHWIENIDKFQNKGVFYCAICDGPLFKDEPIGVMGGGNSAIEESIYLSSIASKIYIFAIEGISADEKTWKELKNKNNIEVIDGGNIKKINGEKSISSVEAEVKGEIKKYKISALFPYIGQKPISEFVSHLGITDEKGYIITNEDMETKIKGIYAVGDIRTKNIRQVITAAADGSIASKIIVNKIQSS